MCVCVTRKDLMNVAIIISICLFQSFNERETKAASNYHQHLSALSAGIQTDRTFRVIYDAL